MMTLISSGAQIVHRGRRLIQWPHRPFPYVPALGVLAAPDQPPADSDPAAMGSSEPAGGTVSTPGGELP